MTDEHAPIRWVMMKPGQPMVPDLTGRAHECEWQRPDTTPWGRENLNRARDLTTLMRELEGIAQTIIGARGDRLYGIAQAVQWIAQDMRAENPRTDT